MTSTPSPPNPAVDATPAPEATCRCGALRIVATSAPVLRLVCHCNDCRAASGQPFTDLVFFRARDTTVEGDARAMEFTADSGARTVRERCARCDDFVVDRTERFPKIVGVVAGKLVAPPTIDVQSHVWVDRKQPGVTIPPGMRTHPLGAD